MIKLKRLNLDSSWHINFEKINFIIDPWLLGSEIDGFKWLNEQWHIKEPVKIKNIPSFEFILISQNYEDHCHINTLQELPKKKTLLATKKAFDKLSKYFSDRKLVLLKENKISKYQNINFLVLKPNKKIDPIYYALVIFNDNNEGLFYAPHGFELSIDQLKLIKKIKIKLLITTFTEFELPNIMGGKVNPGMDNVYKLYNQIKPKHTINTHDEKKKAKGLVSSLAKIKYADINMIEKDNSINFIKIDNYKEKTIS